MRLCIFAWGVVRSHLASSCVKCSVGASASGEFLGRRPESRRRPSACSPTASAMRGIATNDGTSTTTSAQCRTTSATSGAWLNIYGKDAAKWIQIHMAAQGLVFPNQANPRGDAHLARPGDQMAREARRRR